MINFKTITRSDSSLQAELQLPCEMKEIQVISYSTHFDLLTTANSGFTNTGDFISNYPNKNSIQLRVRFNRKRLKRITEQLQHHN